MVVFSIFAANMSGLDFIHQDKLPVLSIIKLHGTPAVTAVPQTVVMPAIFLPLADRTVTTLIAHQGYSVALPT